MSGIRDAARRRHRPQTQKQPPASALGEARRRDRLTQCPSGTVSYTLEHMNYAMECPTESQEHENYATRNTTETDYAPVRHLRRL